MSLTPPTPEQIKAFRMAAGMSQAALADALGASKRAVENWEGGAREAPAMLRLALTLINQGVGPWQRYRLLIFQRSPGGGEQLVNSLALDAVDDRMARTLAGIHAPALADGMDEVKLYPEGGEEAIWGWRRP